MPRYSLTIACTTPGCPAYLTVPRADADKYAKAFTCQRCQDDAMAEHYLSQQHTPKENGDARLRQR